MTIKASSYPTSRPTLDLNFAQTKRLDPRVTFTRSSTGTYFDANGVLQSAATNTARFDHNPATGESLGLLVEEARTNSQTYSNYSLGFSTSNAGVMQDNATVAPDGSFTALRTTRFTWGRPINTTGAQSYSVYVKQDSSPTVAMGVSGYGNPWTFTFATKTLTPLNGSWTVSYTELPNGWFRINAVTSLTLGSTYYFYETSASTTSVFVWGAQLEAASFPTSYIPTPATFTSRASSATYYDASGVIQTAGTNVARSAAFFPDSNGVMRSAGLLLEAASTNLHTYSEQFDNAAWTKYGVTVTANAIAAPDGATTADKFASTAGAALLALQQAVTRVASTVYTVSIFAKSAEISSLTLHIGNTTEGTVFVVANLSAGTATNGGVMTKLPNGWYRISRTFIQDSGTVGDFYVRLPDSTVAGSGVYVWGAQLEASPYATSYIPTVAATVTRSADVSSSATVTRSADVASITGTNFSSWYNQSEGSVFADITDLGYPANIQGSLWKIFASTSHVSGRNAISLYRYSGGTLPEARFSIVDQNAATVVDLNTPTSPTRARVKSAIGLKSASYAATSHGNTAVTSSTAVPPTYVAADTLAFGQATNSTSQAKSCLISRLTYWPTRLSDATLQAITL